MEKNKKGIDFPESENYKISKEVYGDEQEEVDAKQKRQLNKKYDSSDHHNLYQKAAMKELTTGKTSGGKAAADLAMDTLPMIMMGYIGAKGLKKSEPYKAAKLREAADSMNYRYVNPDALTEITGKVTSPSGLLGHEVYRLWGKEAKKEMEGEAKKIANRVFSRKIENGEMTLEEASKIADIISSKKLTPQAKEIQDEISSELLDWAKKNVRDAKSVVNDNVRLAKIKGENGKVSTKVQLEKGDRTVRNSPAIAMAEGAFLAGNGAAKDIGRFANPGSRHDMLLANEKGLTSTGLPSISEIVEGTGMAYNKNEAIKEMNKAFDYIMENGDEEQLKRAYEVYNNTNFNKKSEVISALKRMLGKD